MPSLPTDPLAATSSEATPVIASPLARFLAALVDVGILGALVTGVFFGYFFFFFRSLPSQDLLFINNAILLSLLFVPLIAVWIGWIYGVLYTWRSGASIGKKIVGLRVMKNYGAKAGLGTALGRETLRIVTNMIFPLHFLIFATDKNQDFHDLGARTVVIQEEKKKKTLKIIAAIAWIIFLAGMIIAPQWLIQETTKALNHAKDNYFKTLINEEEETEQKVSVGELNKIFYDSLYNGVRTKDQTDTLIQLFNEQLYNEQSITTLFGKDTDSDGFSDSMEEKYNTNAVVADTDGDGKGDREEILSGSSPTALDIAVLQPIDKGVWQVLNDQETGFTISYPVGWGFKRSGIGDYFLAPVKKDGKDLDTALLGISVEEVRNPELHAQYYFPDLYTHASLIRPTTIGSLPAEVLYYEVGIRIVIIKRGNTFVRIFETFPDQLDSGVLDRVALSFIPK